ncbi:MAG: Ig-like domain-containing protein, partial [Candidatus Thermoplasmatota archaeon]
VTAIVSVYDEDCVDGEVQKVWLGLNGIWELASKQDKNWTARLNTASLSDGTQKMYVKVFDGIVYYVKAIRIIIDNTKPNIVILKPSEYERVSGIIIIEGKALDANGVKNISLLLTHNDTKEAFPITDKVVPDVLGTWSYELNTTNYYEGSYNLTATAFDGRYINTTSIIIVIDNNKPPEILYSPMNATITIEENSTQEFRVVDAKDPEGRILTKYWYLRKELITGEFSEWQNITDQALSDNGTYLFKADYTSSGMYQIKVVVWDVYYYGTNVGSENVTQIWSLTVKNVNRMPQILVYTNSIDPLARELIINELDSIEFAVDCIDSDNDTLFINWSVNNVLKYSGRTTPSAYTFNTDYKSSGDYIVEVNISDSCDSISLKWLVRVKNVNRAPTAAFSPLLPVGEYRNITAYTYEIFSIESVSDEDEDNLTITWRVNGKVMKVTVIREVPGSDKYTHEFREGGLWNVSVEIFDGKTRILNYWLVNVYVEPKVEPPTFELGIAVCAILAAALIALSIKILRKK